MFDFVPKKFLAGVDFARNNPQIIYTFFLLVVIPAAFLYSGQTFLDAAKQNHERLEKDRIGIMNDALAVAVDIDEYKATKDYTALQEIVSTVGVQNEALYEFKILVREGGKNVIIASLDEEDVGREDVDANNAVLFSTAGNSASDSYVNYVIGEDGARHMRAARALVDDEGNTGGFILTDISMASIDYTLAKNTNRAYFILFFIILAIFILLVRHARIIDYVAIYKRLKEVDQMKDDFIAMATHELKTPLTAIRGYLSFISPDKLSEKERTSIKRVDISVGRLNRLIGDILDVARIEQGRMKFEMVPLDPTEAAAKAVDSFDVMAREKGLELRLEMGENVPRISADPERLEQVFINLIGNAIKYTPKGGVDVEVSRAPASRENRVRIKVSDTGLGISAEGQKRLFQRFSRIRTDESAEISGTGMGLWITKQIVEKMGGDIAVESIEGKGSAFTVSFLAVKE